jgi:geranylgeranyl pyrophosphate synthase
MRDRAERAPRGTDTGGTDLEREFSRAFDGYTGLLGETLEKSLPTGEGFSGPVVEAMRYSLLAPGKRIRPVLTMISAEIAGKRPETVLGAACAVEMIHTASLILDDLPSMDNATLRRGRETLHLRTDEATAILAANALLMQAFHLIADAVADSRLDAAGAAGIVRDAADCVGVPGMIGGQWQDLHPGEKNFENLEYVHSHKTGALFILSATLGARLAGAGEKTVACLAAFAKNLGLAFQVVDDILDRQSEPGVLGKDVHRDTGKETFVTVFGLEDARVVAHDLVETAKAALGPFGGRADLLCRLADYVYLRRK